MSTLSIVTNSVNVRLDMSTSLVEPKNRQGMATTTEARSPPTLGMSEMSPVRMASKMGNGTPSRAYNTAEATASAVPYRNWATR